MENIIEKIDSLFEKIKFVSRQSVVVITDFLLIMNKLNSDYKVGDVVIIKGEYSDSAYGIDAYNSKAIGWEREILYIIEDGEFPYALGYNDEVTGYFKANSIEKKYSIKKRRKQIEK